MDVSDKVFNSGWPDTLEVMGVDSDGYKRVFVAYGRVARQANQFIYVNNRYRLDIGHDDHGHANVIKGFSHP